MKVDEPSPRRDNRRRSRSRSPRRNSYGGPRHDRGEVHDKFVYISNIPYDTRWMELKDLVRDRGGGEVKFVEILEDREGRSKGSAVAEFDTKEALLACVQNLDGQPFKNRNIVVKEVRDPPAFFRKVKDETGIDFLAGQRGGSRRDRAPERDLRPPRHGTGEMYGLSPAFLQSLGIDPPLCDRVFVANLAYNVQTGKLFDIFSLAGQIKWMDYQCDKEGKSKGICVIQFSHPLEAVQAISMLNNQKLYDRGLIVKMDRFDKDQSPRDGELPRGLQSIGMGLGANGAPLKDVASVVAGFDSNRGAPAPAPMSMNNAPMNMNMPNYDRRPDPMPQMGMMDRGGPSMGGGASMGGGPSMSGGGGGGYNSFPQAPAQSYGGGGGYGGPMGGGGGYQAGFPDPAAPISGASRAIVIKNLPVDYSWSIVRDRAQQFGPIESVDIISPGVARVRFVTMDDAERARRSLEGSSVEGQRILVDFVL